MSFKTMDDGPVLLYAVGSKIYPISQHRNRNMICIVADLHILSLNGEIFCCRVLHFVLIIL